MSRLSDRPLRVKEIPLVEGLKAFASDGAPSDCVALAVMGYLKKPVDLIVSGINPTGNFGHDITYSGTVTAAMEGTISVYRPLHFRLMSAKRVTTNLISPMLLKSPPRL